MRLAPSSLLALAFATLPLASCGTAEPVSPKPQRRQATKEGLASYCATDPCKSLDGARADAMNACAAPTSAVARRQGKCDAYDVLVEDSDLVTYSRYYDASGALIGVRAFSHEWANRTDYGTIPECVLGALVDVCQYRDGLVGASSVTVPASSPTPAPPPPPQSPPSPAPPPSSSVPRP